MVIAPSILAADFAKLGEEVRAAEAGGAGRIHVDVMDGHFVPNLSMGPAVCAGLRPVTRLPLEVHLMVTDPGKFVDGFVQAGADSLIFHLEVQPEPLALIERIRGLGKGVGLALNPDFPLAGLKAWIPHIDLALCMTVFPGFGGQAYLEACNPRIRQVRQWIDELNPRCELEVDGGIDAATIQQARAAGATVFVAGTSVFRAPEGAAAAIARLRQAEEQVRQAAEQAE